MSATPAVLTGGGGQLGVGQSVVQPERVVRQHVQPAGDNDRLNVLRDDPFGLYYRLTEAQLSAATR